MDADKAITPAAQPRLDRTVNYHFIKNCNFSCFYCYATFDDSDGIQGGNRLPDDQLFSLTALLAQRYKKVTFAGGEPTIYPRLPELFATAKAEGAMTNLVTNGYRIDPDWVTAARTSLDLLTLSVDSDILTTHVALGRADRGGRTGTVEHYQALAAAARAAGIRVKVNTVVTKINQAEDISGFIRDVAPERWKVLQAAPVDGQNDKFIADLTPERADFDDYVARHETALTGSGIRVVAEPIETIRGSYIMVDPQGRFFDSTTGRHHYSRPILDVGIDLAFTEVTFDAAKFHARGGDADYREDRAA